MPENPPPFPGFTSPRYTMTPNELYDWLLAPGLLTEAELRVLLYIIRHTFGWAKDADAISLSQFTDVFVKADGTRLDWGAGIGRDAASRAVKGLERKGCITVTRHRDARRGDAVNVYALRFAPVESSQTTPLGVQQDPPSLTRPPPLDSLQDSQKNVQNTAIQEGATGAAIAVVLSGYGGAWGTLQPRAQTLCAARGWSAAQLAQALASRPEQGLRRKLGALEAEAAADA